MVVYLTEHVLPGLTDDHVRSVRAALTETSRRLSRTGEPIRLLECSYLAAELRCTFAATAENQVRQALELAQLPLPTTCRPLDSRGPRVLP
jgi:hypothetical protein